MVLRCMAPPVICSINLRDPKQDLRTDAYGGSAENNLRFPRMVVDRFVLLSGQISSFPIAYLRMALMILLVSGKPDKAMLKLLVLNLVKWMQMSFIGQALTGKTTGLIRHAHQFRLR